MSFSAAIFCNRGATWLTTLAGRFGVALDRTLLYTKVGGAWMESSANVANLTTGAVFTTSCSLNDRVVHLTSSVCQTGESCHEKSPANRRDVDAELASVCFGGAQQINGTPGSAAATTTIDGKQLPPPDPKFSGVIKDGTLQSKPWWSVEDRSGSMLLPRVARLST